jgi:threonine dehydrogenase-like Zn-dependent dehydrogenase
MLAVRWHARGDVRVGEVPPHEFAGVVVAVGHGVTGLSPGQRVAVDTIVSCGSCRWCWHGEVTRCAALGALGLQGDGGLAVRGGLALLRDEPEKHLKILVHPGEAR